MKKSRIKILEKFLLSSIILCGAVAFIFTARVYPVVFKGDAYVENQVLQQDDAFVINFSKPIITAKSMQISIFPQTEIYLKWKNNNRQLVIAPKQSWKPGQKYTLEILKGKTIMLTPLNEKFEFKTEDYPFVENFYPLNGEKDIIADMEDPITVSFDKSMKDYAVKFVVNPNAELAHEMSDDKRSVKLLPETKLVEGKNYTIDVYVRHKKETQDSFKKVYSSSFETKIFLTPEKWEKDPGIKLEQALKYTVPLKKEGKYIDINLNQQVMVLFEDGKAQNSYLISSGKKGMETPKGSFQIHNKATRVWSKKYALFMPYWMAILPSGEVGIHELPEWPGGYKEGANHLGMPVSHGCVRLGVGAAKQVFEWSVVGTKVVVH